jgi:uncharacterized protein YbbC (DUF1343 family)
MDALRNGFAILAILLGFSIGIALPAKAMAEAAKVAAVKTGMERLDSKEGRAMISGYRWAVLSHPASRGPTGEHLVDYLFRRQSEFDISLVSLFSPEHGFRGDADVDVPDSIDPKTGLPVYSLYGPREAPTPELLSNVDGVIIDLQDVGVRFYTFATTMALVMKACRESGKKVVVLDRPNPTGGDRWEGAILERALQGSLAAYYPIPTVHGLTLGELAILDNDYFSIGADLSVLKMEGWHRSDLWTDTGLKWIPPSPALTTFEQAELYSFLGTLEAVNFAVGRGITNERAFRIFGAPWITSAESKSFVGKLNALGLPGLSFRSVSWKATRSEYEGKVCRGFEVLLTDFRKVEGLQSLLAILVAARAEFRERFDLSKTDRMLGQTWIRAAIERGVDEKTIEERIRRDSIVFDAVRAKVLLY